MEYSKDFARPEEASFTFSKAIPTPGTPYIRHEPVGAIAAQAKAARSSSPSTLIFVGASLPRAELISLISSGVMNPAGFLTTTSSPHKRLSLEERGEKGLRSVLRS